MCRARLGSKPQAWARLCQARAQQGLEPGPHCGLRLGSGSARLEPGLLTGEVQVVRGDGKCDGYVENGQRRSVVGSWVLVSEKGCLIELGYLAHTNN